MSTLILASANKPVVKTNTISKKTKSSFKSPMLTPIERPNDFLAVAERVNGRAAMIGFTSAVIDEIMTGNSLSTQFHDTLVYLLRLRVWHFLEQHLILMTRDTFRDFGSLRLSL